MVSQGEDRALSFGERLSLRVHLSYCRGCRNMRRQLVFLRRAVRRLADA